IPFHEHADLVFNPRTTLPFHPNGLTFTATLTGGGTHAETYFSIGGGFVVQEGATGTATPAKAPPFPVESAADLLRHCREQGLSIPDIVRRNELTWRRADEIRTGLRRLADEMRDCAFRGCHGDGVLPGGLNVVRRA